VRDAGGSVLVHDLKSAKHALQIIVDQGEGRCGEFSDRAKEEKAHYFIFHELKTDKTRKWDTYNVRENPRTEDYHSRDIQLYHVSLAFDAAYCYLLLNIEHLWTIHEDSERKKLVFGNMYGLMLGVLAPLAKFLVTQSIGRGKVGGEAGAPCFEFYNFSASVKTPFQCVKKEIKDAITSYVDVTSETTDQAVDEDLGPQLKALLSIQTTIHGLLDVSTFQK